MAWFVIAAFATICSFSVLLKASLSDPIEKREFLDGAMSWQIIGYGALEMFFIERDVLVLSQLTTIQIVRDVVPLIVLLLIGLVCWWPRGRKVRF